MIQIVVLLFTAVIGILWLAWELLVWTFRLAALLAVALFDGVVWAVGMVADCRR